MSTQVLVRLPSVIAATGLKRSSVYSLARQGKFPKPVKIGPRCTAWVRQEVEAFIADRIAQRDARSA